MKENKDTKICPFCGEEIKNTAIKCKYCGEFLNEDSSKKEQNGNVEISGNSITKKNTKKVITISIVTLIFIILSVIIVLIFYFVIVPKQKDKEITDAFKSQFTSTYPEISDADLKFSDLTEINRTDTQSSYFITVSNDVNSLTYSFIYNFKNETAEQLIVTIPSCEELMNKNRIDKTINAKINENIKNDEQIIVSGMKNSDEYMSYELLSNAEKFDINNVKEYKKNYTDVICGADFIYHIKKSEFKTINIPTVLRFKQCEDNLDFCSIVDSTGQIEALYKTPAEYEAVSYDDKNTKQYVKDYVKKALGKISFKYPYPYKDLFGQYTINIAKNGKLLSARIVESTGNSYYDSIVLNAITSAKYPPLPDKYPDKMITIKLGMNFQARNENYYENDYSSDMY